VILQYCEGIRCHGIVGFKLANFILCASHSNLKYTIKIEMPEEPPLTGRGA
jgi:hypothetical protein